MQKAVFGGGCFWCTEAIFKALEGVVSVKPGYSGGDATCPTYIQVVSGKTGHAEVVHINYDPKKISYRTLLEVFWNEHDPTQVNRQGPDWGSQYRSVIFYHSLSQKKEAHASKQALQKTLQKPIATTIEQANSFWKADEHHQKYLCKHPIQRAVTRLFS